MADLASFIPAGLTPALSLATMDRHLGWALVLTAATMFLLRGAPRFVRSGAGVAVFIMTIAPVSWSISHWLGLAYQTPSLMTQGLVLIYLLRSFALPAGPQGNLSKWPSCMLLTVTLLGWVLVLDTFAVWPLSLYALGYSDEVAIFGLILAVVFWMTSMRGAGSADSRYARHIALLLLGTIALYAFTRLPSGNAWDAMLDPWLWLVAQTVLLVRTMRYVFAKFKDWKQGLQGAQVANPAMLK